VNRYISVSLLLTASVPVLFLTNKIYAAGLGPSSYNLEASAVCEDTAQVEQCLSLCYERITHDQPLPDSPGQTTTPIPRELFLYYFEKFQSRYTIKAEIEAQLPNWLQIYHSFLRLFPEDELIPSLQLNLAGDYTKLGMLDSSLAYYSKVISQFDNRTRFGTEALFFAGQIYYLKKQYEKAVQAYEQIRSTVFLPISRDNLTVRIAECRFRIMELALEQKDTSRAL